MADSFLHSELLDGQPVITKKHHTFVGIALVIVAVVFVCAAYLWVSSQPTTTEIQTNTTAPKMSDVDLVALQLSRYTAPQTPPQDVTTVTAQLEKAKTTGATGSAADRAVVTRQLQMGEQ